MPNRKPIIFVNGEPLAGPLPLCQRWGRGAIREGRKWQTRRLRGLQVVNAEPSAWEYSGVDADGKHVFCGRDWRDGREEHLRCPYGKVGDIRYLREPLERQEIYPSTLGVHGHYADDGEFAYDIVKGHPFIWPEHWTRDRQPQMLMPCTVARTFVRMLYSPPKRVQDMSEAAAVAEGCPDSYMSVYGARQSFRSVWDSIHGDGAWERNEWVWVVAWELLRDPTVEVSR